MVNILNWKTLKQKIEIDEKIIDYTTMHLITRFKDLKKVTGLSNPALSSHLQNLKDDKILVVENGCYMVDEKYSVEYLVNIFKMYPDAVSKLGKHDHVLLRISPFGQILKEKGIKL